jgi:hypothetical protein
MNKRTYKKSRKNNDIENVLNTDNILNKINETKNLLGEIIKENKKHVKFNISSNNNNKNNSNQKNLSMPKIISRTQNTSQNQKYLNKVQNKINIDFNNATKKLSPYITSVSFKNIQTGTDTKLDNTTSENISKKNNKVSFGKSLNEVLINNINEAIMKKGSIIQKIKRKNYSSIVYRSGFSNFNDYDLHKKIFDLKLVEIYEDYQKKQSEYRKQRIEELMPSLELRRQEVKNKIPLYIKGYKKKDLDIFYTRNVCDLDYQRYYNKNQLNLNEILENHNKYNRKDYLSGSVPFFLLTKSVFKPMFRKNISQTNLHNKHNVNKISF